MVWSIISSVKGRIEKLGILVNDRLMYEFLVLFLIMIIGPFIWQSFKERSIRSKIDGLKNNSKTLTPNEFFALRNSKLGGRGKKVTSIYNFPGVYVLYNKTKNMYYIGQAKRVLDRVNAHFTGHGNGDVYADYRNGDSFEISMMALKNSGFQSLNEMERLTIRRYNAFSRGYNRTRGNKG